jgi:hypothetical protein
VSDDDEYVLADPEVSRAFFEEMGARAGKAAERSEHLAHPLQGGKRLEFHGTSRVAWPVRGYCCDEPDRPRPNRPPTAKEAERLRRLLRAAL